MPITINGTGSISGLSAGGLPDASVTGADLNGAQTGSAPIFGARAWVNIDGTGTIGVRASGNIDTLTDGGTGIYTVTFATPMPDANYSVIGAGAGGDESIFAYLNADVPSPYSTTQFEIKMQDSNDVALRDTSYVWVAFFR